MWRCSLAHLQTLVGWRVLASRPSCHLNIQIKGIEDWPFECTYSLIACMLNKIEEVRILVQNNPFSIFSLML